MSRSIQRRTLASRLFIGWVLMAMVVSFAGTGYAAPSQNPKAPGETSSTPEPGGPGIPEQPPAPPAEVVDPVVPPAEEPVETPAEPVAPPAEKPDHEKPVPTEPVADEPAPAPEPAEVVEPVVEPVAPAAPVASEEVAPTPPYPVPAGPSDRGVTPTLVLSENPTCPDHLSFKIDISDLANTTYTTDSDGNELPEGASITISGSSDAGFDFSVDGILIYGVIVKGGNAANIYNYDSFGGVTWDGGLLTVQKSDGGYYGISHITFCYEEIPDHDKSFTFTMNGDAPEGTDYFVRYLVDDVEADPLFLTGENPYSETVTLPHGSVISNVRWYARWYYGAEQYVDILLGTTEGETLTEDMDNPFSYEALIEGHKYEDLDADGVLDEGEPGLEGWEIVLERDVEGTWVPYATTTTDADGYYSFDGVLPGDYRISEVMQVDFDWTMSMPEDYYFVTVTNDDVLSDNDFMNWAPASIEGNKYGDLDGDGEWDEGEDGLAGWLIYVDYDDDGEYDDGVEPFDITDADGHYYIENVTPGTYTVREQMLAGWSQTQGSFVVTFESRQHYVSETGDYDFGNRMVTAVHGVKYHDTDADGDIAGEPTIEGWEIHLDGMTDAGAEVHLVTFTDENGYYEFTDLLPGDYVISEGMEDGWFQSYPEDPGTWDVDLAAGDEVSYDFGNWTPGEVSGIKFLDADGDGAAREEGEVTLPDWVIYVDYDNDGVADADEPFDVTDANGAYNITGILPGTWVLREVLLEGWDNTYPAEGQYDIIVGSGTTESGLDFGNFEAFAPLTEIDAGIVKVVDPTSADPGDVLTYTLTYTMVKGSVAATETFTVTDDYDERYLTPIDASGGAVADGMIVWTINGPLAEGASGSITYTMRVASDMPDGTTNIDNTARIRVPGDDNPANDVDTARVVVDNPFAPFTPTRPVAERGEEFLPFTGTEALTLLLLALSAIMLGATLRRMARYGSR